MDFNNIKVGDIILRGYSSWGCRLVEPMICTVVSGKSRYFQAPNHLDSSDYCCEGFVIHSVDECYFSNISITNYNYFNLDNNVEFVDNNINMIVNGDKTISWWTGYENDKRTHTINNDNYEICNKCGALKKKHSNCANCVAFAIKSYDYKDYEIQLVKPSKMNKGEEDLFIGFELEFEVKNTKKHAKENLALQIKELLPNFVLECKRDGSLNNGFEVLSQPIHINRINTSWYINRIRTLFKLLKDNDCEIEDTCGLHFHLSNKGLGDIRRTQNNMLLLTDTLQEYIKRWSNRLTLPKATYVADEDYEYDDECNDCEWEEPYSPRDLFHYCRFINDMFWSDESELCASYYDTHDISHYNGVNIENTNTTEFRFFASTLDEQEFMTDINLLMAITRLCKKENVNRVSVADIVNKTSSVYRERLVNQVESLGLDTMVYDYDVEPRTGERNTSVVDNLIDVCRKLDKLVNYELEEDFFFRRWLYDMGFNSSIFNTLCGCVKYKTKASSQRKNDLKHQWKQLCDVSTSIVAYLKEPSSIIIINTKTSKPNEINQLIELFEDVKNVR